MTQYVKNATSLRPGDRTTAKELNTLTHHKNTAADYILTPSLLADVLKMLILIRQPMMLWGPPGVGKSDIVSKVAQELGYRYLDVRALLLDPVDLRGIPWRDEHNHTRWAPPSFLPPESSTEQYLINLEELPSAPPSVQSSLLQLLLGRGLGEYRLPPGAAIIGCGNRESDRANVYRMLTSMANRFVHIEVQPDQKDWMKWATQNDIHEDVMFFLQVRPELLHQFDPNSKELAFPSPRTWHFVSNIHKQQQPISPEQERAIYRGTIGEGAAIEFCAFLRVCREIPHPNHIITDPTNASVPDNMSTMQALCGSLYRMAEDTTFDAIETYAERLPPEVGQFLIGSCVQRNQSLQQTRAFVKWAALNRI